MRIGRLLAVAAVVALATAPAAPASAESPQTLKAVDAVVMPLQPSVDSVSLRVDSMHLLAPISLAADSVIRMTIDHRSLLRSDSTVHVFSSIESIALRSANQRTPRAIADRSRRLPRNSIASDTARSTRLSDSLRTRLLRPAFPLDRQSR